MQVFFLEIKKKCLECQSGVNVGGTRPLRMQFFFDVLHYLWGPEVVGKYSADLFAKRAKSLIKKHNGQPWFIYLSLQSVHAPMQVLPLSLKGT